MEAAATAATPERPRLLSVSSWVLYDLANTMFSMNIVSLFFSLWIVNDMGGKDSDYGLANSFSMFVVFLVAPFLGALSDQTPRRMPFLIATTLVCCLATFLLGITGVFIALLIFIVANVFYQSGLIFYDALLPEVSTPENRGRVGGIGVGVGYMGSFIGVLMGLVVLENLLGLSVLESNPAEKSARLQAHGRTLSSLCLAVLLLGTRKAPRRPGYAGTPGC